MSEHNPLGASAAAHLNLSLRRLSLHCDRRKYLVWFALLNEPKEQRTTEQGGGGGDSNAAVYGFSQPIHAVRVTYG